MRGTHVGGEEGRDEVGLIPTYAGNTRTLGLAAMEEWAHPHVCGEHAALGFVGGVVKGSSPRMRGTPAGQHE